MPRVDTLIVGDDALLIVALANSTWNNLPDADPAALPKPSTKFTLYRGTDDEQNQGVDRYHRIVAGRVRALSPRSWTDRDP